jgi:hypothetical protein
MDMPVRRDLGCSSEKLDADQPDLFLMAPGNEPEKVGRSILNLPRFRLGNYGHILYQCEERSLKIHVNLDRAFVIFLTRPASLATRSSRNPQSRSISPSAPCE